MNSHNFKLLKVLGILLLVILASTTLYYECSKGDPLSGSAKPKTKNEPNNLPNVGGSNIRNSDCITVQDFEDAKDKSVITNLDSLVVKVANSYINDYNDGNPNNNDKLALVNNRLYCNSYIGEMNIKHITQPVINDITPIYTIVGSQANEVDTEQRWDTLAYKEEVVSTTSTAMSRSWGLSTKISAGASIPIITGGITIALDFSFNTNSTESKTNSKSDTWTMESQHIMIPPHRTYELLFIVYKQNMHSKISIDIPVNFTGILFAKTPDNMPQYFNKDQLLYYINKYQPDSLNDYPAFTTNDKGEFVYRNTANIEATYGLKYEGRLRDITDPKKPILIKTIALKRETK